MRNTTKLISQSIASITERIMYTHSHRTTEANTLQGYVTPVMGSERSY